MPIIPLILFCATIGASPYDTDSLVKTFQNPPKQYRPETWFHFIGGNIGAEGITADLTAIQQAGLSGVQLFNGQFGGAWPGVPQVLCLSPEWDKMIAHTAEECKRLGLKFSMEGCAGWSMAGGPWVPPSRGMRHLCESRTDISAGQKPGTVLPVSPEARGAERDYKDICVLAFPLPAGDSGTSLKPQRITADGDTDKDTVAWARMLTGKGGIELAPGTHSVTVEFNSPQTLRTLMLPSVARMTHAQEFTPLIDISVAIPDAAGRWAVKASRAVPRANWQDSFPLSLALPEMTSKRFRITFKLGRSITLDSMELQEAARTDDWQGKAAYTLRNLDAAGIFPRPNNACVALNSVIDISSRMDVSGNLNWSPPSGRWAVLRCGHYYTGAKNGPAPAEATGPEVDKMDASAADLHFSNYIGRLSAPGGPAGAGLNGMVLDSWECVSQTWTPALEAIFAAKHGYALRPWLPALQGWVVENPERSERFLRDWRSTLSDLITDGFYGEMARLARQRGITTNFETAIGDVVSGDILRYMSKPDVPMCEYWYPDCPQRGGEETKPILPTASAAHIYGKKVIAAESLTSVDLHWDESFGTWKSTIDKALSEGVNQVVFHTYTHNPRIGVVPGTSFGAGIGSPFLRGQTWWPNMHHFTDYIARCETLLQAGNPANDVLWFLGDELDHKPRQDTPFPQGFKFDYCNADVLQNRLRASRGLLTNPEGTSWKLLWLKEGRRTTPATLRAILRLLQSGANIVGNPPKGCATNEAGADRICDRLVKQIWGANPPASGDRRIGSGRLLWYPTASATPEPGLEALKVEPDLKAEKGMRWIHRTTETAEIYFVAASSTGFTGPLHLRAMGVPMLLDPIAGTTIDAPIWHKTGSGTDVWVNLPESASLFVMLKKARSAAPHYEAVDFRLDDSSHKPGFSIVSAHYGVEGSAGLQADVTRTVKKMAEAGARAIVASNTLAGDPALRHVKSLWIVVQTPNGQQTLRATEGQSIRLPFSPAAPAAITIGNGGHVIAWSNGTAEIHYGKSAFKHTVNSTAVLPINGKWQLSLHGTGSAGQNLELESPIYWSALPAPEVKWFSGTGTYHLEFTLPAGKWDSEYLLDLGALEAMASVSINGKPARFLWLPPYRTSATGMLHAGRNSLDIEITNTWRNRLSYDASLPEDKRLTWTISGPGPQTQPDDAGLEGPVLLYCGKRIGK